MPDVGTPRCRKSKPLPEGTRRLRLLRAVKRDGAAAAKLPDMGEHLAHEPAMDFPEVAGLIANHLAVHSG